MFNDRIGRVKDNLSRTVILLEFIDLGIGIIFSKSRILLISAPRHP